jgi:hypothetical protein
MKKGGVEGREEEETIWEEGVDTDQMVDGPQPDTSQTYL